MRHELKILPEYFSKVLYNIKTFEVRKNDRDFKVGDTLVLKEWDEEHKKYTGKEVERTVSYILYGDEKYGLQKGYCIMALKKGSPVVLD